MPWWAWLGGLFSVLLILAQLYASPAIGAASFLGIIVTVGVAASIVLDNYGWVGFPVHPVSLWRILGAVLMVAASRWSLCSERTCRSSWGEQMTASVVPLPLKGSALQSLDATAAEMLAAGRATTLTAARISLLLESVQAKRSELVAVIDDLQSRPPSGNAQVDQANADLSVEAVKGPGQIDQVIRLLEIMQPKTAIRTRRAEPGQPLSGLLQQRFPC